LRSGDLRKQVADVEVAVLGRVSPQPAGGLLQLTLASNPVAAAGLVPGDGDVHEPLEEVALGRLGRSPRDLELFVSFEVRALADQL